MNFTYASKLLQPVILNVTPQTDLTAPASTAVRPNAPRALGLPGATGLQSFEIAAAARYLGQTAAELRRQIAAGSTLREISRAHGRTLAEVRQAALAAVRATLPQTLR